MMLLYAAVHADERSEEVEHLLDRVFGESNVERLSEQVALIRSTHMDMAAVAGVLGFNNPENPVGGIVLALEGSYIGYYRGSLFDWFAEARKLPVAAS